MGGSWGRSRWGWLAGAAVLAVLLAGSVVGSGWPGPSPVGSSSAERGAAGSDAGPPARAEPGPAPSDVASSDAVAGPAAPAPDAATSSVPPGGAGVPVGGVQRALARTAQLSVTVDDPAAATRAVRGTAAAAGGTVVEEQTADVSSWLVLRVPAALLDRVLDDVAALGRPTARSSQVADRTEEVVDLDARVASGQAGVARVRALLAGARSIGDVVVVESELSRREADLDSLTGRLAALRDQVAFSTVTVDLRSTGAPPPAADPRAAGFLDGLRTGWDGLRAVGSGAAAVLGFLLPFLPVLAVLVGIGWLARRALRTRRVVAPGVAGAAGGGGRSGPGSEGES